MGGRRCFGQGIGSLKSFLARTGARSHFVSVLFPFDPAAGINC